jgi:hypothetical protein
MISSNTPYGRISTGAPTGAGFHIGDGNCRYASERGLPQRCTLKAWMNPQP